MSWASIAATAAAAAAATANEGRLRQDTGVSAQMFQQHPWLEQVVNRSNRNPLPVDSHAGDILRNISEHDVTIVEGAPGCGKTSRLPVLLLEHYARQCNNSPDLRQPNIVVTQPTRLAAVSMAEHVANDYNENVGKTIGVLTDTDHFVCPRSLLVYCTTKWLLHTLFAKPSFLLDCTHLFLDEVHERDLNSDMLYVCVRRLLIAIRHYQQTSQSPVRPPAPRLIICSATLPGKVLSEYFASYNQGIPTPLFAGPTCYSNDVFYLEDMLQAPVLAAPLIPSYFNQGDLASLATSVAQEFPFVRQDILRRLKRGVLIWLCTQLTAAHSTDPSGGVCVMVFLSGTAIVSNEATLRPS